MGTGGVRVGVEEALPMKVARAGELDVIGDCGGGGVVVGAATTGSRHFGIGVRIGRHLHCEGLVAFGAERHGGWLVDRRAVGCVDGVVDVMNNELRF